MARKVKTIGSMIVINQPASFVSHHGWGGPVTDAGQYFHRMTHQAESLRLRLRTIWLASPEGDEYGERAGRLIPRAEARVERRDHDRRNVQAAEIRLRFQHVLRRAELEAQTG